MQAENHTADTVPPAADTVPLATDSADTAQVQADQSQQPDNDADAIVQQEAQPRGNADKGSLLKHINFWHEDELKMSHPDVQASCQLCNSCLAP